MVFVWIVPHATAVVPAAPANLFVTVRGANWLHFTWQDTSSNELSFTIDYFDGSGWEQIDQTAPNQTSYDLILNDPLPGGPGGLWTWRVRSWNAEGFCVGSSNQLVTTNPSPLFNAPTSLSATVSGDSVALTWLDNANQETGYIIEYSSSPVPVPPANWIVLGGIGPVGSSGTTASLSLAGIGFAPSSTVSFRIRASRSNPSVYSGYSNEISVTIPPIAAPTDLAFTLPAPEQVKLTWVDNSSSEGNYEIQYRLPGETTFQSLTYTAANAREFVVSGAPPIPIEFRVRATQGTGPDFFSAFTGIVTATAALATPTGLAPTLLGEKSVTLTWVDNSTVEEGYDILYRAAGTTGTPTLLGQTPANSTSVIIALSPGDSVEFFVRARYLRTFPAPSTYVYSASSTGLTVTARDGFTSDPFKTITFGQPFTFQLATTTTSARTSWSANGLPAGLAFNSGTGIISGTPAVSGLFNVVLGASFANGWNSTGQLVLRIAPPQAAPLVAGTLANASLHPGGSIAVSLSGKFSDPDTQSAVRMSTTKGNVDIILYNSLTPITTANFLGYMTRGDYNNCVFNRISTLADSGVAVLQGGQLKVGTPPDGFTSITTQPAIQNEPGISNVPYTIAMAKQGGNPNSATSQFYFNLDPFNTTLDSATQNGGFTVFGRVSLPTRTTIDALKGFPGGTGNPAPNDNYPITIDGQAQTLPFKWPMNVNSHAEVPAAMDNAKVMVINSVSAIPASGLITYSASSDNAGVATAVVNGGNVDVQAISDGTCSITVTATDLDGASMSQRFAVTVGPAATSAASSVTSGWVKLNGSITLSGQSGTAWFEYGTTNSYGIVSSSSSVPSGAGSVPISSNIGGLAHGVEYHYRLVLTNANGTFYGADQTFTFNGEPSAPNTSVDKGNGYCWFRGADDRLWVCWWGGSSYLAAPITAADCAGWVAADPVTHYCWYRGTDSRLRVCWFGGGAWNNGPVTAANCSGSITPDSNTHYIWYRGTDSRLYVCWYAGGWLSGSVSPAICGGSVNVDSNRQYVWYQGSDSKLYVCWWGGSSWLNGSFTAANCAGEAFPDKNNGYCWYRGTDNRLYVCWFGGGAWNYGAVTGPNCSGEIFVDHNSHFVWYRGTDLRLYVCWWGGSSWLNGSFTGNDCSGGVVVDSIRGYVWYSGYGLDYALHVCWFGGGGWNAGAVTGPTCHSHVAVDESSGYVWYRRYDPASSSTNGPLGVAWFGGGVWNNAAISGTNVRP